MNKSTLLAATAVVTLACASPLFAMGGGGGMGGYGSGGYGGSGGGPAVDDYSMAVSLIHREKYAEAIPHLAAALQQRPHSADVYNYLGYTHRMLGKYPESLAFYQRALDLDPDHKGAHEYLGELYLMMDQVRSANLQLAELTRLCPNDCDEKDVLTKAIADYQAKNATPPAQAATPAPATPGQTPTGARQ